MSPLRTTVTGSWWPAVGHEDRLLEMHRQGIDPDARESLLRDCAARAIAEQRDLGLTEWTGGEYFTDEFLNHMQAKLTGIEIDVASKKELFDYDDFAHANITGPIEAPDGLGYAEAYLRERDLDGGVRKSTVVGPLEIAFNAIDQLDELKAQMPGLTGIVNAEMRALADAGCPHVQLDVPAFSTLMSMGLLTPNVAPESYLAASPSGAMTINS